MSAQYDYLPGLDLSSLTSATLAQITQAIAQLSPLLNIGGVITQPALSSNTEFLEGNQGAPDVTNNPRFAKYLWLNTFTTLPIPFYYDSIDTKWKQVAVAAGAINPSQLAPHVTALDHMFYGNIADPNLIDQGTGLGKIIAYDFNGRNVTQYTRAQFMSGYEIDLVQISTFQAFNLSSNYIKFIAGQVAWGPLDLGDVITGRLPLSAFNSGTDGYLLQMQGADAAWVNNDDAATDGNYLPAGSTTKGISLSKLKYTGATTRQVIMFDGANLVFGDLALKVNGNATINSGSTSPNSIVTTLHTFAHGFGAVPKLFRAVLYCNADDGGFKAGDELDVACVHKQSTGTPVISVTADAINVKVSIADITLNRVPDKAGGTYTNLNNSHWFPKVYAWA